MNKMAVESSRRRKEDGGQFLQGMAITAVSLDTAQLSARRTGEDKDKSHVMAVV